MEQYESMLKNQRVMSDVGKRRVIVTLDQSVLLFSIEFFVMYFGAKIAEYQYLLLAGFCCLSSSSL